MGKGNLIITIDGPAASGKTSVSSELAKRLGWKWVSTGAFYRGLAFVALQKKANIQNEEELAQLCQSHDWDVELADERTRVLFMGQDVTAKISAEEVGSVASRISHYPKVREGLLLAQRNCAEKGNLIAEGRDCGTVVFPSAHVKIYLTAKSEDRALRRAVEQGRDVKETLEQQKIRDNQDTQRATAPLQIPEQADIVDTSQMSFKEVVDQVEQIVQKRLKSL